MKKIMILLVTVGMFGFQGCTVEEPTNDNDTISTVFENSDGFNFTSSNNYKVRFVFPSSIISTDMVLVYRLAGVENGRDVWEFLPETYYFDDGTRDFSYNFNFTNVYVDVYLSGNEQQSIPSGNRLNQFFRFVVVPANLVYGVDKNNYNEVISALNIKENQIQKINF